MESMRAFNALKCNKCGTRFEQQDFTKRERYHAMRDRARAAGWKCWDARDYDLCENCPEQDPPDAPQVKTLLTNLANTWQEAGDECKVKALVEIAPLLGLTVYYENNAYKVE